MTLVVPKSNSAERTSESFPDFSALLDSAREFVGCEAGWIGLQDADGRMAFPVHRGTFSEYWLPFQQARDRVWGLAVSDELALVNDCQTWLTRGDPALRNLLSCPLIRDTRVVGHIALANKPNGFAAQDAAVLQGLAHHLARLLGSVSTHARTPLELSASWRRILDDAAEGVLVLDSSGILIFANAAWLAWTGFCAEELLGRSAPFPFWVSQEDLVTARSLTPLEPGRALPFRRRDRALFWCQVETVSERWDDWPVTVAFLQQSTPPAPLTSEAKPIVADCAANPPPTISPPSPNWLPLLLDRNGGIDGWDPRWEELTGLSAHDVQGSGSDLVLDWLFSQQHDRERVADCFHHPRPSGCQLLLDIATATGSASALCTFFPLSPSAASSSDRRWLLLVGEAEHFPAMDMAALEGVVRFDAAGQLPRPHPHGEHAAETST